jgi:hypothetical protein
MRMASMRLRPPTLLIALDRQLRTVAGDGDNRAPISSVEIPL